MREIRDENQTELFHISIANDVHHDDLLFGFSVTPSGRSGSFIPLTQVSRN